MYGYSSQAIAAFFLALAVPLLVVWNGWEYGRLMHDGQAASGVVTRLEEQRAKSSRSYHVHYRFRDVDGRQWSGSQRIDHGRYKRLYQGQPISVTYSRSNPKVNTAYLAVLREHVKLLTALSFLICLICGMGVLGWRYATQATLEHDRERFAARAP